MCKSYNFQAIPTIICAYPIILPIQKYFNTPNCIVSILFYYFCASNAFILKPNLCITKHLVKAKTSQNAE